MVNSRQGFRLENEELPQPPQVNKDVCVMPSTTERVPMALWNSHDCE